MAPTAARSPVVLAVGAHPDDIEFMMAGTLLRLGQSGAALHVWNLANGMCGTAVMPRDQIVATRAAEAQAAAAVVGATLHPPIADDLAIFFEPGLLARAAAVVRQIRPDIILAPSPQDYMEDHSNTCRLVVTAAFVRGMRNFATQPPVEPWSGETVIYHAQPYGLRDGLRRLIRSGQFVDIAPVLPTKRRMLACHRSQKEWLDVSQGLDAYLNEMESMAREVGRLSGRFDFAEGWRRHSHLGFAASQKRDPLVEMLGEACRVDDEYERSLDV
jgi:LmbE family N-acetylglucosaminyl deacetylase